MVNVKVFLLGLLSVLLIVPAFFATSTQAASVYRKRSTSNICHPGARCGWYVYNKTTRHLEDPHKACECPKNELCTRTEDDISISAYVYRCRPESQSGDTNLS
ncbi:unnamed protein product [Hermetia illucens]|uniref:Uncharacterized protein n=1 Tax=Hermetia illucens TaxID=343691 RepID=A0A7R8UYL3_HERIL|nr:uncharacterized protein LOC119654207 [Hermetia illucens]CAD7088964.1 unnamed protein product [Hermetia illucens]